MLKRWLKNWRNAFREAVKCIGLGLRDLLRGGLWWRSALLCMAAFGIWLWLYIHYAEFFLYLAGAVSLISFLGMLLGGFASGSAASGSVVAMGNMGAAFVPLMQMAAISLAAAVIFYVLLFIFGMLSTIRLPLNWLFMKRAKDIVANRYPDWQAPKPGLPEYSIWYYIRKTLIILLSLCVPILAALLVFRVFITFNIHLIYFSASHGVLSPEQRRALRKGQKQMIFALGLLLFIFMFIPFINLLLPALMCTSVAHLQRRSRTYQTEIAQL